VNDFPERLDRAVALESGTINQSISYNGLNNTDRYTRSIEVLTNERTKIYCNRTLIQRISSEIERRTETEKDHNIEPDVQQHKSRTRQLQYKIQYKIYHKNTTE